MARSVAASNNRPNYIYILSRCRFLSYGKWRGVHAAGVRQENVQDHEGDEGRERKREKKRKGAEKQGGREDRDEVLGGSANSRIEYVRRGRPKLEMIVKQRVMGAYLYGEEKTVMQAMRSIHSLY